MLCTSYRTLLEYVAKKNVIKFIIIGYIILFFKIQNMYKIHLVQLKKIILLLNAMKCITLALLYFKLFETFQLISLIKSGNQKSMYITVKVMTLQGTAISKLSMNIN